MVRYLLGNRTFYSRTPLMFGTIGKFYFNGEGVHMYNIAKGYRKVFKLTFAFQ